MNDDIKKILIDKYISSPKGWLGWLNAKSNKYIRDELSKMFTNHPDLPIKEKVYWIIHDMADYPKCSICGKPVKHFQNRHCGYYKHCGCVCAQLDKETRQKHKQTCLEKYGVDNPAKSEISRNKYKQTCIEKYGVDNAFKSEYIKEKMKITWIEKYGVDNPRKNLNIINKCRETLIKRYGVACGFLNGDFKNISKGESELYEFVKQIIPDAIQSDRTVINPLELDIYIPSLNIAFEYDGDYWHSIPAMKSRDKLKDKMCKDKNIFLIRVKECEWCNNNLKTKNMIKQILNDKIYG